MVSLSNIKIRKGKIKELRQYKTYNCKWKRNKGPTINWRTTKKLAITTTKKNKKYPIGAFLNKLIKK
jgi:hypothetical protein